MTAHSRAAANPDLAADKSPERLELSDAARDVGDRLCCGVLVVAVAVAIVLGGVWFLSMPAIR